MRTLIALFTIVLVAGSPSEGFAQEFTTKQVLEQLDQKAKTFSTLEASISRGQVARGYKSDLESGKIYIKLAKSTPVSTPMLLLDITAPDKLRSKALIANGNGTLYKPATNSYMGGPVDPNNEVLQLLLLGFGVSSSVFGKVYRPEVKGGREAIGATQAVVLELTSISEKTAKYPKVTLWLDPKTWTPVQTRLQEPSPTYWDYKYSDVRLNRALADSVFRLNMPANAKKQ